MSPRRREGPVLSKASGFYFFDQRIGYPPDVKRVRYTLKTRDPVMARQIWMGEYKRQWALYHGQILPDSRPVTTPSFRNVAREFVAYERNVRKAKEWEQIENRLVRVLDTIGEIRLGEFGVEHIAKLDAALAGAGRGENTRNHYFALLRTMFNFAIAQKYASENPLRSFRPYPINPKRRAYTDEEMSRIITAAADIEHDARPQNEIQRQCRRLVLLLYHTGMRLGEALNLRWDSITDDIIHLERTDTKQRREKIIPINAPVRAILDELAGQRIDEHLFPLRRRQKRGPFRAGWADSLIREIRARSGVADFLFHGLRHTASTIMASRIGRGATLADVMMVLGHSKTETTIRYQHASIDRMLLALDSIPEVGHNPVVDSSMDNSKTEQETAPEKSSMVKMMKDEKLNR